MIWNGHNFAGIEREIGSLQLEEKKLVAEIKKTAKTGNEVCSAPDRFVIDHLMWSQLIKELTNTGTSFSA
jgi:hypothetical protein